MQAGACTLWGCRLLQVAEVLNGDVGDSGHSRDVVGNGDSAVEHGSDESCVVVSGELAVLKLRAGSRDLDGALRQSVDLEIVLKKYNTKFTTC